MISVTIFINGNSIITRSAVKTEENDNKYKYKVDDGRVIEHDYKNGAVLLAIKLLEGVKE